MKKKNMILFLVILVILIVGGCLVYFNQNTKPKEKKSTSLEGYYKLIMYKSLDGTEITYGEEDTSSEYLIIRSNLYISKLYHEGFEISEVNNFFYVEKDQLFLSSEEITKENKDKLEFVLAYHYTLKDKDTLEVIYTYGEGQEEVKQYKRVNQKDIPYNRSQNENEGE